MYNLKSLLSYKAEHIMVGYRTFILRDSFVYKEAHCTWHVILQCLAEKVPKGVQLLHKQSH